ncbi:hypothetical protein [Pectobacterium carotovorum]|uniref:primase 1D-like protein n=1 Tax=Pectobacterium carotovorum TaxID=554 RepID=UPI0021C49DC1|nr:hypothetical protein [Pectobacterium carotovorum]GKW06702.1 hypothetical protein PEC301889_11850 [Pectobacterium carotovorum subsp. carotovorum]
MSIVYANFKKDRHPISYINEIAGDIKATLNYSKYYYFPQSIEDNREVFSIDKSFITQSWFEEQLFSLDKYQELSLNSLLIYKNRKYHIPMIDFSIKRNEKSSLEMISELAWYWSMDFIIFSSGRSYHAYGTRIIKNSEWIKFMGSLLLLNIQGKTNNLIDTRWVGHRILSGYSSLRWSNNTSQYKQYPIYIGRISEKLNFEHVYQ